MTLRTDIGVAREAVIRVTRTLAEKGVTVTQMGSRAYCRLHPTNGKLELVNIPQIPDNASREFIRAIHGFIDHELGHVLESDFKLMADWMTKQQRKLGKKASQGLLGMHNIVEDVFIEKKMRKRYRGSNDNLNDVSRFVCNEHIIPATQQALDAGNEQQATVALLMPAIRKAGGDDAFEGALKEFPEIADRLARKLEPFVESLRAADSTADCIEVAERIYAAMKPPEPDPEDDGDEGDEDKGKPEEDEDKEEELNEDKDEGKEDNEDEDEKEKEEKAGDDDKEGDDADDDKEGDDEESEESDEGDDSEGDDEEDADEGEDDGDTGEGESEEDDDDAGDADEGEGSGDDEDENEDDGGEGASGGDGESEDEGDEKGEATDGEAGDGDDGGEGEKSDEAGVGAGDDFSLTLSDEDMEELEGLEGGMEEALSKSLAELYEGTSESDMKYVPFSTDADYLGPYIPPNISAHQRTRIDEMITEARRKSHVLQGDFERLFAAQSATFYQPGLRKGKLNPTSLHRLLTKDDRIFRKKIDSRSVETAVSLVVDLSGSMGGPKIDLAMLSALIFGKLLDHVDITNEIFGFTTGPQARFGDATKRREAEQRISKEMNEVSESISKKGGSYYDISEWQSRYSRWETLASFVFKSFTERLTHEREIGMGAMTFDNCQMRNNADGDSILIAAERLLTRPEKRKVMIVLSDGYPAVSGPSDSVNSHLHNVIRDVKNAGVEMFGIGICSDSVKTFYPDYVVLNNAAELPKIVLGKMKDYLIN